MHPQPKPLEVGDVVIERGWPIVVGTVGGITTRFLVDTGSQGTLTLDSNRFAALVDVDEQGQAVVDVEILDHIFANLTTTTFDFSVPGWYGIDAVLGASALENTSLTIDYAGQRLWIGDEAAATSAAAAADVQTIAEVSLRDGGIGHRLLEAEFEGVPVDMLLDTGASVTTAEPSLLDALGRDGRPSVGTGVFQPGSFAFADESSFARVRSVSIGEAEVTQMSVLVLGEDDSTEPPTFRGLLGFPYLRHFFATVDGPERRLTLAAYPESQPVGDDFVRLGFDVTPGTAGWVVTRLFGGSSAEEQLAIGDVVERVDGEVATGDRRARVEDLLFGYEAGCEVSVRVQRAGESLTVKVEAESLLDVFE